MLKSEKTKVEVRLQKLVSQAGIASRRQAEEMILSGRLTVNGKIVRLLGTKANPNKDHIKVDGKLLHLQQRLVYILMNKPKGVITSLHDPQGRPTVMNLLRGVGIRVYPVGRLDFDTEGVLLLTNDGDMTECLMHPRNQVPKRYWAKIRGTPDKVHIDKLSRGGLRLPQGKIAPCRIQILRSSGNNSWVEITLREGKKRQVREMFGQLGHPVSKLKRVSYAFLTAEELPPGSWRYLTPKEIAKLKKVGDKGVQYAQSAHTHK